MLRLHVRSSDLNAAATVRQQVRHTSLMGCMSGVQEKLGCAVVGPLALPVWLYCLHPSVF